MSEHEKDIVKAPNDVWQQRRRMAWMMFALYTLMLVVGMWKLAWLKIMIATISGMVGTILTAWFGFATLADSAQDKAEIESGIDIPDRPVDMWKQRKRMVWLAFAQLIAAGIVGIFLPEWLAVVILPLSGLTGTLIVGWFLFATLGTMPKIGNGK
jgi:hypothetical protein